MNKNSKTQVEKPGSKNKTTKAGTKKKASPAQDRNKKDTSIASEDISDELKIHQAQTERD
jgi:hypothetical protein